ncbi:hypothetical protein A10D4_11941 [Idiomarina xiamenensis 10-D-4]|uniref:Uncharacterized protein n=1 Tax=Idiomarina xiamenensis 10-D-4 TaxID=740709 RepID=K2KSB5_9GAMM|nr:hypothetical protein A10D4_11941 [Idiomarina xiamenensis 10-D-4]
MKHQPDNPMRCRSVSLSCKGKINHLIRLPENFRGNKWEVEKLDKHEYGDIGAYRRTRNKLAKIGKCLHFNAGDECTSLIRAHFVQKSQLLSVISKNNHIYAS